MPDLILSRALLPSGWASDVRLSIDASGIIRDVAGSGRHAGPAEAPAPVGPRAPEPAPPERVEGVTLPGLANVHSHAFQRALAGLAERRGSSGEESFWSWREAMYAFLARLTPDDVEAVAEQLYVEMLLAGYTSVGEFHYLHHAADGSRYDDPAEMSRRLIAAADRAGISLTLLPVVYVAGDFGGAPPAPGQRRFLLDPGGLEALLGRLSGSAVRPARLGVALHSLRAVPPEALRDALAVAAALDSGAPLHIHVAEQVREVEACLAWSGARPVEWLLGHAPVDARWCLVHATHVDGSERERLAASGAVAGLCPTTEANLGDGLFPLKDYLAAGGRFGVGSDSHVSVSPVEELRWLEYGQRLLHRERNVAAGFPHPSTGRSLLEAAAAGGAQALGRAAGALEVGRAADLVVLDDQHPLLYGRADDALLDAWIFSGNRPLVRHVMAAGRWVVRDGHHPREEGVRARYRERVAALSA